VVERASIRLRTTALAVLVMAVALAVGAVTLVLLTRASLRGGIEDMAEERATALAAQISASGLPAAVSSAASSTPSGRTDLSPEDEDDDTRWRVLDASGTVVLASPPGDDEDQHFLRVTEDAGAYTVVVEASLEEVGDATRALVTPLVIGVSGVMVLVGGVTWVVVTGALAPVERIRREVEEITGERLDRRVPIPVARDEIHRLASTMNRMLVRLQDSRDRQQRFVADASHELRSPLAGIRQAAEVARTHPGALPEGELAEAVLEEAGRMERLVEQLLLLTRTGGAGVRQRQDVDIDDLALAEVRRVRRAGLTVDSSGVGAGRVRGDRTALAQVVRNLVDNAARHAHGTVAVAVRSGSDVSGGNGGSGDSGDSGNGSGNGGRAGYGDAGGDGVTLVVEDDGAGIPESERERVFERFVRLDEARDRDAGGSGLGLAIVREIVTAHGGTVTVSTSALGGARFVVRLPPS
jgi:signal transduction histidine kinase